MIISRLSDYLKEHRRVSLIDLARDLDATQEALREMLATLERKGRARKLPAGSTCGGGCGKCNPNALELYEWTGMDRAGQ